MPTELVKKLRDFQMAAQCCFVYQRKLIAMPKEPPGIRMDQEDKDRQAAIFADLCGESANVWKTRAAAKAAIVVPTHEVGGKSGAAWASHLGLAIDKLTFAVVGQYQEAGPSTWCSKDEEKLAGELLQEFVAMIDEAENIVVSSADWCTVTEAAQMSGLKPSQISKLCGDPNSGVRHNGKKDRERRIDVNSLLPYRKRLDEKRL